MLFTIRTLWQITETFKCQIQKLSEHISLNLANNPFTVNTVKNSKRQGILLRVLNLFRNKFLSLDLSASSKMLMHVMLLWLSVTYSDLSICGV